ncbi:hypothetical protein BDZ89DRAFT_694411 [Hymenopellis radicata]|nr:hypothetical protein BDZ89DRAFT_694411 [Hymenopellis radicata]
MRIRSDNFFFCLPVRLGVFILTMFGMIGGVIVSATGWLQVSQLSIHPLARFDTTALYFHTIVFTIIVAVALFGLAGAITKRRPLLTAYGYMLAALLGISIASGCVTLFSLFRAKDMKEISECENGSTDPLTVNVCQNGVAVFKGTAVGIYIVTWLYLSYACIIVASYVGQLRRRRRRRRIPRCW